METETILASGTILSILTRGIFLLIDQKITVSSEIKQAIFAGICILTAYLIQIPDISILEVATALFTAGTLTHGAIKLTSKGKETIKESEGYSERAYKDQGGTFTIGYGTTYYPDGKRVQEGDSTTKEQAESIFETVVNQFANEVQESITSKVNENQFSALVSLAYNIGIERFKTSTVLRRVNNNPEDPTIRNAFLMWNKIRNPKTGKIETSQGLINRRNKEIEMYFS